MGEQKMKEYFRRTGHVFQLKRYRRHKIRAINTWAAPWMLYEAGIGFKKHELQVIDQKTRKSLTTYMEMPPTLMRQDCMYRGKKQDGNCYVVKLA